MLRIYLPWSTDLKLCSEVNTLTFVTLHLGPGTVGPSIGVPKVWVPALGTHHLGPSVRVPMRHLMGPRSSTIRVPGPKDPLRAFAPDDVFLRLDNHVNQGLTV